MQIHDELERVRDVLAPPPVEPMIRSLLEARSDCVAALFDLEELARSGPLPVHLRRAQGDARAMLVRLNERLYRMAPLPVGQRFDTEFERGCTVVEAPSERGTFVALDSEGVSCTFSVGMITRDYNKGEAL